MTRNDFVKIIRLRTSWRIDKRRGNYRLPDGSLLSSYIEDLVIGQLMLDAVAPTASGELAHCVGIDPTKATKKDECGLPVYHLFTPFGENEECSYDEMQRRIKSLVNSVMYG